MKQNGVSSTKLAMIGLMAAMVFAATNIRYPIPTPVGNTMLHLGNVMCLLSGFLLGGIPGGLAAGIGSFFFDLFSEYASEAPITFINKFLMAFAAGYIAMPKNGVSDRVRRIIGGIAGAVLYVVLYLGKTFIFQTYFQKMQWQAVAPALGIKGVVSLVNGLIAVAASILLAEVLIPALRRANIWGKLWPNRQVPPGQNPPPV